MYQATEASLSHSQFHDGGRTLGGVSLYQFGATFHLIDAFVVVESIGKFGEKRLLTRIFCEKRGRIFHCPGEQRRCLYSLGQTMPLSFHDACLGIRQPHG